MPRLALHFLGTPRIELDGAAISFSYSKAMAFLVYLSLTRQSHTRQALAALFWPDDDPPAARREIRRMIWVLNKNLGQGWLEVDHQTVQLPLQPDLWLDVERFRELLAQCTRHGHPADDVCPACLDPLTEAVALARSDFLAGFSLADSPDFDDWQTFEKESLRRELAGALERLVQLLSLQRDALGEQVISYARRWLALDPLHEPAHCQLMQLYAWSGQPAAALRQYQLCAQVLKEELGILPSAETTALYEAIKANRLSPRPQVVALEGEAAATQTPDQHPKADICGEHTLPVQPTPFIGRQQEAAVVRRLLTQETPPVRLVTLTGTGGAGKTRLALHVVAEMLDHFDDGIFFIPLASLTDPDLLASTIARQLDIREGGGQPVLQTLKNALREKRLLLVLDNFEQIVSAAPVIAELLAVAPRLKVLVTSRILLRLQGEYEFLTPPLKLPDRTRLWSLEELREAEAVQLFVERAQATSAGFALTAENAPIVAEICHRLDCLPLAIELAAARVKLLPPQTLLPRLSRRLAVLTGGAQDVPARQQTLRNTIDWSYSLLDPAEQTLFNRLGVFMGGFTLETAEAVCDFDQSPLESAEETFDVLEGVSSLLNKSLLTHQTSSSQPRFRMLETLREYALERLEANGRLEVLQRQHAHYFAAQIDQIGLNFQFYGGLRLDWAEEEHDNIRAVLAWSLTTPNEIELGLRMIGILYWFWYRRGYLSEGRGWCERFMEATDEKQRTVSRALFLMGSGSLALMQGDLAEAGQRFQESIAVSRELGDERLLAVALPGWGVLALHRGDANTAQAVFEEALALGRRFNLWWIIADSLLNLGNAAAVQGDYSAARNWLEQATTVANSNNIDTWLVANVLNNLGEVARIQGDYEQAQRSYEESQTLFRAIDAKPDIARSLHSLGYVAQHQKEYQRAETCFREGLRMFQQVGNKRGMAECLAGLAGLVAAQGQAHAQQAARFLAAAEAQIRASGSSWWPADRIEVQRNLTLIQAALDSETFTAAWTQGQALSLAQAIAEALDWLLVNDRGQKCAGRFVVESLAHQGEGLDHPKPLLQTPAE